jgi:hypothetical protein
MTNVFFGFGHGFGGTHLLANLLNVHPNVDCKHERRGPTSAEAMFDKYMPVFHGDKEAGKKAVLDERLSMIGSVVNGGKVFGEVNGILGFFVRALFQTWPRSKFIYIMRDPRTIVRTSCNSGIFDQKIAKTILNAHPEWSSIWWWPIPAPNDPVQKVWSALSNYEKCAWFWAAFNEFVIEQLNELPKESVFYYKFEDMIKGLRINEVYDFLGLKYPTKEQVQKILSVKYGKTSIVISNPIPVWENQSEAQKKSILVFVESTMKKLGYTV